MQVSRLKPLHGKHILVDVFVEVFSVTRLWKIIKKPLLQPPQLVIEVLTDILTDF